MTYHWNSGVFFELAPDGEHTYWMMLLLGMGSTLFISLSAWLWAWIAGGAIGILKTLPNKWVAACAHAYIELFRNIPLLIQLFLWYFVFPECVPSSLGYWIKSIPYASFIIAIIGLGFYTSARLAVHISSGIMTVPCGQKTAAMALGLTLPQTYRHVLLPSALRLIFPVLTSEWLSVIKNSAVALTIGVVELTASGYAMQDFTFQTFEAMLAVTLGYLLLNKLVIMAMAAIETRLTLPGWTSLYHQDR